jgi:hypothetical protein
MALHHHVEGVCQGGLVLGHCQVRGAVETMDVMTVRISAIGLARMRSHSNVHLTSA